ncbi:MAG TPA: hypothetical protein DEP62_02290, partial [Flavobacteriales bacterium]|nr:hypothetical protein [Flavobacteriales bacterium]
NWDTTLVHARVGEEFDQITFWHEEPHVLLGLNADGRLNQGRLDHTFAITEPTGLTSVPWVDMRVGCDAIPEGDSVLVRVEHHWAAPDEGPAAPYVEALSDSHFWVVDGTWEDGTPGAPHLDARLTYVGNDENDLDHGLYGDTEEGGFLAWRPRAGAPWVQHPHYTWQAGSLANGSGVFKIAKLLKGQYTFAKGDVSVGLDEPDLLAQDMDLNVWPNPASDMFDVQVYLPGFTPDRIARMVAFDAAGRQVWHSSAWTDRIAVGTWAPGLHTLVVEGSDGQTWTSSVVVTGPSR